MCITLSKTASDLGGASETGSKVLCTLSLSRPRLSIGVAYGIGLVCLLHPQSKMPNQCSYNSLIFQISPVPSCTTSFRYGLYFLPQYFNCPLQTFGHVFFAFPGHSMYTKPIADALIQILVHILFLKQETVVFDIIWPNNIIHISWWVLPEALQRHIAASSVNSSSRSTKS